jgi:hypothetical protein
MQFMNDTLGWVSLDQADHLLRTLDGGLHWDPQLIDSSFALRSFYFVDGMTGWAIGASTRGDTIYRTADGGINWTGGGVVPLSSFYDLFFATPSSGWAVGGQQVGGELRSTIIKTSDAGLHWIEQQSPSATELLATTFLDEWNGWAVGDGVIATVDGGGVVSADLERDITPILPTCIKLHQNYPNPFNPFTTIEYTLVAGGFVSLEVYDILGQRVRTLAEGWQSAGDHRVLWTAAGMGSGTYFCRLLFDLSDPVSGRSHGSGSRTSFTAMRMILVK